MLATYMTVTLGLLLLSGVVIGALMSGFVMREQKQDVANEIAVVSELYLTQRQPPSARTPPSSNSTPLPATMTR
jgi:hypothetical protein